MNNQEMHNQSEQVNGDNYGLGLIKKESGEHDRTDIGNQLNTEPITVRIKTMDETEKRIQVSLDEKVSDLKNKIRDQMDVPLERQRLIYLGKQLKDEQKLSEYKIKDDV